MSEKNRLTECIWLRASGTPPKFPFGDTLGALCEIILADLQ